MCGRGRGLSQRQRFVVCLGFLLVTTSCAYTERKWKEKLGQFNKRLDHEIAEARGKEGRCLGRGGVLYGEQCYLPDPDPAVIDQAACRLHGGLFLNDECYTDPRRAARLP